MDDIAWFVTVVPVNPRTLVSPPTSNPPGQELGPALHAEEREDGFRIPVNRVRAEDEPGGDLFVAVAIE